MPRQQRQDIVQFLRGRIAEMKTGTEQDLPARLEAIRRRFERWRQTRDGALADPRRPVGLGGQGGGPVRAEPDRAGAGTGLQVAPAARGGGLCRSDGPVGNARPGREAPSHVRGVGPARRIRRPGRMRPGGGECRRGQDADSPQGRCRPGSGGPEPKPLGPPGMIQITPQMRILVALALWAVWLALDPARCCAPTPSDGVNQPQPRPLMMSLAFPARPPWAPSGKSCAAGPSG